MKSFEFFIPLNYFIFSHIIARVYYYLYNFELNSGEQILKKSQFFNSFKFSEVLTNSQNRRLFFHFQIINWLNVS